MRHLIGDLEREARARSESLEAQRRLPARFTQNHYPLTSVERRELRMFKAAMAIAEGADDFLAICHQGRIPERWYKRRLKELLR